MASKMKYFFDTVSPPSRALYLLFKLDKVPIEPKLVALRKGEHLTDEYRKNVNKFSKVPVLHDNGFQLSESIAILRYISAKGLISDKWYPSEIKQRAQVDEFLEWQHNNTHLTCAWYFIKKWRDPLITGKEPEPILLAEIKKMLDKSIDDLEKIWLDNSKFVSTNQITVADLFGASALEQSRIAGYEPCNGRPKVNTWMEEVRNATNPLYDEIHEFVYKLRGQKTK